MKVSIYCSVISLHLLLLKSSLVHGSDVARCLTTNKYIEILPRVAPLNGQRFQVEKKGCVYTVVICSDVETALVNASVTIQPSTGSKDCPLKNTTVIGRRNDTGIIAGSSWIALTYGSGDEIKSDCSGPARAEIVITCSNIQKGTLTLRDVADNHGGGKACTYIFDLVTPPFENCTVVEHSKPQEAEGLSNGSVFCIIFLTTVGVYLTVGIFYRRLVKGAKGFEQIPHASFWRKLGNLQADGCDFACRHGDRREEAWQRLTNNFSDPQDDRDDDALLRP